MPGARHSKSDQQHIDQIAAHAVAAGAKVPADPAMKARAMLAAAKALPAGFDPGEYARAEAWDAAQAGSLLNVLADMLSGELFQQDPAGAKLIQGLMVGLSKFIASELADMGEGITADNAEDAAAPDDPGMSTDITTPGGYGMMAISAVPGRLPIIFGAVKAVTGGDEWALDVLGIPYGGPNNGRDSAKQFFDATTEFHTDKFPELVPVVYYHSLSTTEKNKLAPKPEYIGKTVSRSVKADGVWYRVILDKTKALAKRVWDAALKGTAAASSGSVAHLLRIGASGHIDEWPVAELSLLDTTKTRVPVNTYAVAIPALKAVYQQAGIALPDDFNDGNAKPETNATGPQGAAVVVPGGAVAGQNNQGANEMDAVEIQAAIKAAILADRAEQATAATVEADRKQKEQERVDLAVKAGVDKALKAAGRRLPMGAPMINRLETKFDNVEARDLALLVDILTPNQHLSDEKNYALAPFEAIKALAYRFESDEITKGNSTVLGVNHTAADGIKAGGIKVDNLELYADALREYQAMGIKANELDNTAQSGFGSNWIGTAYSNNLWLVIRQDPGVGSKLMDTAIEVPQGFSSIVLPLEGADPTWYKVAETTATNGTTLLPDSSVPTSKVATASKTLTVGKMGARTIWSGEMDEDSLIPFIANLRRQLELSGLEQFTHLVIDGDTATAGTTNINHIGGTPGSTDLYLLFDGFRKSPLVTTTTDSRSASGAMVAEDFLNTIKLLGPAGMNALVNPDRVGFIVDVNTYWKALTLPEVKTRDVNVAATIENGKLTGIYGYGLLPSAFMHYKSTAAGVQRRANTAGKVDQTVTSNNTTGAILAVRYDQWQLGFKRRISIETQRIPAADATQIVALMRLGLVQRDVDASAISYNVGLS